MPTNPSITVMVILLTTTSLALADDAAPYFDGDRIVINATVNQRPIRFLCDTGATYSALFSSAAERLQIETESTKTITIAGESVEMTISKPVSLAMFGQETKVSANVLPLRAPPGIDGVFGWRNLAADVLLLDGYDRRIRSLGAVPQAGWQRWVLDREASQLFFAVHQNGEPLGRVFVDVGAACGLRLSPPLWKAWREQNPKARLTLQTFQYSVGDATVHELAWSPEYRLGDLTLYNVDIGPVPCAEADKLIDAGGREYVAMIGARALRQMRMIISRKTNEVLTQSVSPIPEHNRLGAVFARRAADDSALICKVLSDSPAERAGLRDGDRLLRINDLGFVSDRKEDTTSPDIFFRMPAGTRLVLSVSRGDSTHEFSVTLEDILP